MITSTLFVLLVYKLLFKLFIHVFQHFFECWYLLRLGLSILLLSLDEQDYTPEELVMFEEICQHGEVTRPPPLLLQVLHPEQVEKPSHFIL